MQRTFLFLILLLNNGLSLDSQISYSSSQVYADRETVRYGRHKRDKEDRLPEIITQSGQVRVEKGETARLSCEVAGLGNYVLMWKEKKRVISAGSLMVRKDSRFQLSVKDDVFTLYIKGVDRSDSGEYICEVDVLGRPLRIKQHLEVLVPPVVQTRESHVELYKGQNYTLSCSGQGYPNPRIVWSREDGYLSASETEGLSLPLTNVDRRSGGKYICTASNGVSRPAKAVISVRVKYAPEIEMEQNWMRGDESTEIEIDCIVHADPHPQVTWFRDSGKIFETDRVLMTDKPGRWSIKIINLSESDFGNYSCKASNSLGKSEGSIIISGRPSPPKFTSPSLNFHPHTYNLTWTTEAFSPVTEYKLRYRQSKESTVHEGGVWSELVLPVSTPKLSQQYTLRQLKTGSVYDVVGFAKNKYGWSDHSKTFTFFNKGVDFSTQELTKQKKLEEEEREREEHRSKEEKIIQPVRASSAEAWSVGKMIPAVMFLLSIIL